MVSIHFQNKEEMEYILNALQKNGSNRFLLEKNPLKITVLMKKDKDDESYSILYAALKKLIMDKRRIEWFKNILEEEFFYTDTFEQMQIIDMALSIIEGKRADLQAPLEYIQEEKQIEEALKEVLLSSDSFSLDAFITFRMKNYQDKLSTLIEIAIDEYKMEQDYQMFIQYLREFKAARSSRFDCVHIVNNEDGFIFFDEEKKEMKRQELNKLIDRKLLSNHPIYVDSTTIAPLISMNPKKIYLYTDTPEQGIILTLKLVFDEGITIQPTEQF